MKRLTSIDFLRGLAIWLMMVFHTFMLAWDLELPEDPFQMPPVLLVLAGLLVFFMHWRGFFPFLSMVVHFYQMLQGYKRGKSRLSIFITQLKTGVILIIVGKIWATFFAFWGIIDQWTRGTGWNWVTLNMFYWVDTIELIGLMVIIMGGFFLLITSKVFRNRHILNVILCLLLAVFVFAISPIVQEWVGTVAGANLTAGENFRHFGFGLGGGIWEKILRVPLNWIGGREAPLFPMLGLAFMGASVAIPLSKDNPKKNQLRLLYIPFLLMAAAGILDFVFIFGVENFNLTFHVFPRWFSFFAGGVQGMVIILFLIQIEFNPKLKPERWLKYTRYLRRFGLFAFTVFFYETLEAAPRYFYMWLFPNQHLDMVHRYQLTLPWTIILTLTVILMWSLIVLFLDKVCKGVGTWEWFLRVLRNLKALFSGKYRDPLRIDESLYHPDLIRYVNNEKTPKNELPVQKT